MRKVILVFIVVLISCIFLTSCSENNAIKLYQNEEEVINEFFEGLNNDDIEIIKRAYALDYRAMSYDFEAEAEILKVVTPQAAIPNSESFYSEINKLYFEGQIATDLRRFIFGLKNQDLYEGVSIGLDDLDKDLDQFLDDFDELDYMEIIDIYWFSDLIDNEKQQERIDEWSKIYDAEDIIYIVTVFESDGVEYAVGMTIYEYDEGFALHGLYNDFSYLSRGCPVEIDDKILEMLNDEYEKF